MASVDLIAALLDVEESGWSEYRGVRDDQTLRKLSQGEMARLLRPFGIRPRPIWPAAKRRNAALSTFILAGRLPVSSPFSFCYPIISSRPKSRDLHLLGEYGSSGEAPDQLLACHRVVSSFIAVHHVMIMIIDDHPVCCSLRRTVPHLEFETVGPTGKGG